MCPFCVYYLYGHIGMGPDIMVEKLMKQNLKIYSLKCINLNIKLLSVKALS